MSTRNAERLLAQAKALSTNECVFWNRTQRVQNKRPKRFLFDELYGGGPMHSVCRNDCCINPRHVRPKLTEEKRPKETKLCVLCERPAMSRGLCSSHYATVSSGKKRLTIEEASKLKFNNNGSNIDKAILTAQGYEVL